MTTAIYARISDDRADRAGVDRQLTDCRAFCARKDWRVEPRHEYIDNSLSASKSSTVRPAYRAMIAAVEGGEVNRIVVYMVDRLYRMPRELEDLIDLAVKDRVTVHSTQGGEGIDLSTIDGATMARVVVALASGETRKISARVLRQQADRRKKGLHHGATRPLGYERVDGKFVPKADEVAVIRAAMRSVLGGMSLADIAHEWTRRGVAHPAHSRTAGKDAAVVVYPWSPTSVGHILHSHRNLGRLTNRRGEDVGPGEWPAIVDRDLFDKCNATIAHRRTRGTATPSRRGMLTNLMICGLCGAGMRRGRSNKTEYYMCSCGKVGIVAPFVEELTLAAVRERLSGHDFKLADGHAEHSKRLTTIGVQLTRIDRKIEELAVAFADGSRGASARFVRVATERLEAQQRELLTEQDALRATSPAVSYHGDADALMKDWPTLTADQKRGIIEAIVRRITIAPVGRGKWPVETMRRRVTFG